jgi:hypothetical protein
MKQDATTRNKAALPQPIDLTYGFPGEVPRARNNHDQQKLLRFFELYAANGMHVRQAALEAGFSEKWARTYSFQWIKRYRPYAEWLQAHVAQTNVRQLAIEQSDVVNQIALIGMANDQDYLVMTRKGNKVEVRWKEIHELTREQLAAVVVTGGRNKKPFAYRFRDRDGKLFELGKSIGLFNEKVILEHRHRHLHVTADLSKVPMAQLEAFEAQFEAMLTHEEPANAQGSVPAVRGHQGEDARAGQTNGGSQDQRRQDHQLSRGNGSPKPPKKQT